MISATANQSNVSLQTISSATSLFDLLIHECSVLGSTLTLLFKIWYITVSACLAISPKKPQYSVSIGQSFIKFPTCMDNHMVSQMQLFEAVSFDRLGLVDGAPQRHFISKREYPLFSFINPPSRFVRPHQNLPCPPRLLPVMKSEWCCFFPSCSPRMTYLSERHSSNLSRSPRLYAFHNWKWEPCQ